MKNEKWEVEWLCSLLVITLLTLVLFFSIVFILLHLFFLSPLSPSDETEYEYSGSEEEDEEREMGEPRSVSSQVYN